MENDLEKINEYLKKKEYISLFMISEIAKHIARKIKKQDNQNTTLETKARIEKNKK